MIKFSLCLLWQFLQDKPFVCSFMLWAEGNLNCHFLYDNDYRMAKFKIQTAQTFRVSGKSKSAYGSSGDRRKTFKDSSFLFNTSPERWEFWLNTS